MVNISHECYMAPWIVSSYGSMTAGCGPVGRGFLEDKQLELKHNKEIYSFQYYIIIYYIASIGPSGVGHSFSVVEPTGTLSSSHTLGDYHYKTSYIERGARQGQGPGCLAT